MKSGSYMQTLSKLKIDIMKKKKILTRKRFCLVKVIGEWSHRFQRYFATAEGKLEGNFRENRITVADSMFYCRNLYTMTIFIND